MKNSIGYFLYNERPMSGLINSQVINLLKQVKRENTELSLTVIAFWQPWIYYAYRAELKKMKLLLADGGIKFQSYPFAMPERHFFSNSVLLKFSIFIISALLLVIVKLNKFNTVHARGYFPSLCAVNVKTLLKKIKVIFDGRSLYPLENITLGKWSKDDAIFKIWNNLEKKIVANANFSIGVSQPIVDWYNALSPTSNVAYIPCSVNTNLLYYSPELRNEIRRDMNWNDRKVMVYLGSIGVSTWNDIRVYREYFKKMLSSDASLFFLIITNNDPTVLRDELAGHIHESAYKIISSSYQDLHKWLSASDFGIQVMNEMADSFSRLGVKLTEYLACGLPVVVNQHVGAAKALVQSNNLGAVLDIDDLEFTNKFNVLINNLFEEGRIKKMEYAKSEFSLNIVVQKYLKLYLQK